MVMLVVNAGSSSIRFALFDQALQRTVSGLASEIGGAGRLEIVGQTSDARFENHAAALQAILGALDARGIRLGDLDGAAHRVVHGGSGLVAPSRLTPDVIAEIEACIPLAPLHNPHSVALVRAVAAAAPGLPQFASFDTAFHTTNPDVAIRYAIPQAEHDRGIRRYGFHGISYAGLVEQLPGVSGRPLPSRLLALHLGNGVSLCAVRDGHSVATTMGYSPLDGLTMGTRSGAIDGNAVLRLAAEHGIDGASRILNRESGLTALGGASDMRVLRAAKSSAAEFAIAHFCYWAVRHAGSMIAAMGGLDGIAFTGGIGQNDAETRASIMQGLGWTGLTVDAATNGAQAPRLHAADSSVEAWIVPAEEERTIAKEAMAISRLLAK